jgi:Uma2 family endonuclease
MATTKLWTIEEVERLPDDEFRYALLRGELHRMPPPKFRHGRVVTAISSHLYHFIRERDLGEISSQSGYIFERDPDTLLEPDVAFVRRAHVPTNENSYPEAPDLVVEAVSPSETGPSIRAKSAIYLSAGVRLIWVCDPERRTVRISRADGTETFLTEKDDIDGEDVLPGFRLSVARLFD